MDSSEIQRRVDELARQLSGRGTRLRADFEIVAFEQPRIYVRHNPAFSDDCSADAYEFIRGGDLSSMFAEAEAYIFGLPSREEAQRQAFTAKVADAVEYGRKIGMDIAPLMAAMEALSKNVIEFKPAEVAA